MIISVGFKKDRRTLLCISLGEPYNGNFYKLAAGVLAFTTDGQIVNPLSLLLKTQD